MDTVFRRRLARVGLLISLVCIGGCGGASGGDFDQDDQAEVEDLTQECEDLRAALERANDQIRQANDQMSDARAVAGATYAEMEEALARLEDVEEVPEP